MDRKCPPHPIRGVYLLADRKRIGDTALEGIVTAALKGGVGVVQYRDKTADHARRLRQSQALAELCHQYRVSLIINDDPELAQRSGADGVHLGDEDASIESARKTLGPDACIGVSCYNQIARARQAQEAGADYVAFGSVYPSSTKPWAVKASLHLLGQACGELRIPVVAIGGITPENTGPLIQTGVDTIAVLGSILDCNDPQTAAHALSQHFR